MVDRYTEWAGWTGWADESTDRRPRQGTGTDSAEGSLHLFFAKVRVAGSNPVVRSIASLAVGRLQATHPAHRIPINFGAGSADDPVVESSIRQRSAGHIVGTSQCVIRLTN